MEQIRVKDIFTACQAGRLRAYTDGPGIWIEDTETREAVLLVDHQCPAADEPDKPRPRKRVERMFGARESWDEREYTGDPAENQRSVFGGERTSKGVSAVFAGGGNGVSGLCEDDGQGPYKGFLLIVCEECGAVKAFCAKRETYSFKCPCGHETALENLRPMYMHCKCGKTFRYKTNAQTETLTHNCLDCKAPVDMELNGRETAYVTIGVRGGRK